MNFNERPKGVLKNGFVKCSCLLVLKSVVLMALTAWACVLLNVLNQPVIGTIHNWHFLIENIEAFLFIPSRKNHEVDLTSQKRQFYTTTTTMMMTTKDGINNGSH
jgi:hypothetical protein